MNCRCDRRSPSSSRPSSVNGVMLMLKTAGHPGLMAADAIVKSMLHDLRVLDFSQGISGAYCSKLLADGWADVVKVEPPAGDPLRRWSASGADLGGEDGALFRYLCASKRSVVGEVVDAPALAVDADVLVEDLGPGVLDVAAVRAANPSLV